MGLIDNYKDAVRFKDTIFLKDDNDLQLQCEALNKLKEEYPDSKNILAEWFKVKKGLDGENEIAYQLKKSSIGMIVLRDVKIKYQDLTAQMDYVIVTPVYTYYVECKNLFGNITVTEKGDFIRELTINGRKIKKGMESPLRQVEAQREVIKKIWEANATKFEKFLGSKNFNYYHRILTVAANKETILNTNKAPKEMKNRVIRADALIRQIQTDINNKEKDDYIDSKGEMAKRAQWYLTLCRKEKIDFYEYYKNKFCSNLNSLNEEELKARLIELRKIRSKEMNIPAYYIFTNNELDKLIEIKPKSIEELKKANILTEIKIKMHGEQIILEINKK